MENSDYFPRLIDSEIKDLLQTAGAVCVEGPKWCGKTWSSRNACKSEFLVGSAENNFSNRKLAEMSPKLILQGENPRMIDEWQEVPSLWDAVRYEVDVRNNINLFILTGNSTPKIKGILHSGTGRILRIHMHPMSLFESGKSTGLVSLRDIIEGKFEPQPTGEVSLTDLAEYIIRGGWPANQKQPSDKAHILPRSYVDSLIEYDIPRMEETKKIDQKKMKLLLRSLARNESTTVSTKTLIRDIRESDEESLDKDTAAGYLEILERLFILNNQKPFSPNIRSSLRVKQMEKRHLADPSLAAALLHLTPEKLLQDLNTFGFLFESLCCRDLQIYAQSLGAELYHYQDYKSHEIDAVIDLPNGDWMAFEIKLGANEIESAAANLLKVNKIIEENEGKPAKYLMVLCGLTNYAYQRPDGVYVVPITALKP